MSSIAKTSSIVYTVYALYPKGQYLDRLCSFFTRQTLTANCSSTRTPTTTCCTCYMEAKTGLIIRLAPLSKHGGPPKFQPDMQYSAHRLICCSSILMPVISIFAYAAWQVWRDALSHICMRMRQLFLASAVWSGARARCMFHRRIGHSEQVTLLRLPLCEAHVYSI